jgi:hypothetical protein
MCIIKEKLFHGNYGKVCFEDIDCLTILFRIQLTTCG